MQKKEGCHHDKESIRANASLVHLCPYIRMSRLQLLPVPRQDFVQPGMADCITMQECTEDHVVIQHSANGCLMLLSMRTYSPAAHLLWLVMQPVIGHRGLNPPWSSLGSPILLAVLGQQARAASRYGASRYDGADFSFLFLSFLSDIRPGIY